MKHQAVSKKRRRRRRRLLILVGVCAVVFLFLVALLMDATVYHGRIHAGVTVSGVPLGGRTPKEAKALLDLRVAQAQKGHITLASGDRKWTVAPQDVAVKIDTAATVQAAMDASRKGNFLVNRFRGFLMYFRNKVIPLQGTVDSAKMDQIVADVAQTVDIPPVNAGLVFDGPKIKVVRGQKGRVVDRQALTSQLATMLLTLHETELSVPMTVMDPTVQADDYNQALQQAMTMTDSPVTLTSGGDSWTLDPDRIIAYMDFASKAQGGVSILVPYLSVDKMAPFLQEVAKAVAVAPVDASFKGDGQKAWVVPSVSGQKLDPQKTAEALNAAALDPKDRSTQVAVTLQEPNLTTEEAQAMGITDKLADFQTVWKGTPDRQTNVKITAAYASNVILAPGDVYDFDKQVGPRTPDRGYKLAPGIVGPGQLEDVYGGGICQVSTTLFNAAFFAGLQILERKNHSIFIDHYPLGRDATVSSGSPNLRFRNDTKHYILVRGTSDGIKTKFVIYGTNDGRQVSYTTSDFYDVVAQTVDSVTNKSLPTGSTLIDENGQPGRKIKVVRLVTAADGSVIHKDTFVSIYPMIPEQIEVGKGKPTTTTTKSRPTTTSTTQKSTTTTKPKPTTTTSTTTTTTT